MIPVSDWRGVWKHAMHYLIIGGMGYIARALCARLLADRHELTVLTRELRAVINLQGENLSASR